MLPRRIRRAQPELESDTNSVFLISQKTHTEILVCETITLKTILIRLTKVMKENSR